MTSQAITYPSGATTQYYFQAGYEDLLELAPPGQTIVVTDTTVAGVYRDKLKDYRVLTFPAGEQNKTLDTVTHLTTELIGAGAHRGTLLLGVGGGVVSDIAGFVAATFMRGIPVAYVPTTLLAQVDAAIGGKNGVNVGLHKNMLGTIKQPRFVLFDHSYLTTLPAGEWSNGFAEIIKYGYISDSSILTTLQCTDVQHFQKHPANLDVLIEGCVDVKTKIVRADETEDGLRRLLNFGHTAGHAFETLYGIPHGQAVGLGMRVAVKLSEEHTGLMKDSAPVLLGLLGQYGLPATLVHEEQEVMKLLMTDKKRLDRSIEYVLLEKPGVAVTRVLSPAEIAMALTEVAG